MPALGRRPWDAASRLPDIGKKNCLASPPCTIRMEFYSNFAQGQTIARTMGCPASFCWKSLPRANRCSRASRSRTSFSPDEQQTAETNDDPMWAARRNLRGRDRQRADHNAFWQPAEPSNRSYATCSRSRGCWPSSSRAAPWLLSARSQQSGVSPLPRRRDAHGLAQHVLRIWSAGPVVEDRPTSSVGSDAK